MMVFIAFSLCLGALMGYYAYRYIKRSLLCFGADLSKKRIKIPLLVSSAVIGVGCINIGSVGTLLFFHILFISLIIRFINFLLKKFFDTKCAGFHNWREKAFQSGILPVVISVIIVLAGYFNMHNVVKTQYQLPTKKTISRDYKIALIADVHYGVSLDETEFTQKCSEISSHNPDIVVLAGDITDSDTGKADMEEVFEQLGKIKNNYGIYYIYGNHDRSMLQMKNKYTDAELKNAIEKNGIVILEDDTVRINGEITLVGRNDAFSGGTNGRKSLDELLSVVSATDYVIDIDHQPKEYNEAAKSGCDLVLSGHTHGGQIWPVNIIQEAFDINDGVYGCKKTGADTYAIITSGFAGWSYPVKNSAPSEYVIINIKKP